MDAERLSDEDLLLARDPRLAGPAFGELYARHEALIVAFHQRRVRNPEVAADLAAETFAQALASRARFVADGPGSAVRWLYGIAGNVLRRSLRQASVEQRKMERLRLDRPDLDDAHLAAIEAAGDEMAVLRALSALPSEQRDVVRAYVLEDHSYDDIAGRLAINPATARKRVSRGLQTMRRELEETP
jgi:RNA polymerase sigma-70 factor (ECF subfamily)